MRNGRPAEVESKMRRYHTYTTNQPAPDPSSPIVTAAIAAAGSRADLELGLARLAVAAPVEAAAALADAEMVVGDLADDVARTVLAAAIVVRRPDASMVVRLARRAGVPPGEALALAGFCDTCTPAGRTCTIAASMLPVVVGRLRDVIQNIDAATDLYDRAIAALDSAGAGLGVAA